MKFIFYYVNVVDKFEFGVLILNIKEMLDKNLTVEEYSELQSEISVLDFSFKKAESENIYFNPLGYAMLIDNINYIKAYVESKRLFKMDTVIAVKKGFGNNTVFLSDIFDFIKPNSEIYNFINILAKDKFFYSVDFSKKYMNKNFLWAQIKQKNEEALYYHFITCKNYSRDKTIAPVFYKNLSSLDIKYFFDFCINFDIKNVYEPFRRHIKNPDIFTNILINNHSVYNLVKMINTKNKEEIKNKIEIIIKQNPEIIKSLMEESKDVSETTDKKKTIGKNMPILLLIKNKNTEFINFFIEKGYVFNKMEIGLIQLDKDFKNSIHIEIKNDIKKLDSNILIFESKKSTLLKKAEDMSIFLKNLPLKEKEELFNHYYENYFYSSMCLSHRTKLYQDVRESLSFIDHYIFDYNVPVIEILIKNGYKFNNQQNNILIFKILTSPTSLYKDDEQYDFFINYLYSLPLPSKKEFILYAISRKLNIYDHDILLPVINEVKDISKDFLDQYINFEVMHPIAFYYALQREDYQKDYLYHILKLHFKNNKKSLYDGSFYDGSEMSTDILFSLYKHNPKDFSSIGFNVEKELISKFENHILLSKLENKNENIKIKKKRI